VADIKHIGKYEILEEIGRGGFAVVYKARDPDLDRVVALKVLAPHLTWDPTFAERFRREAQATANLRHSHIVTIHEVGQADEHLYIAMEYLSGSTLAELLRAEGVMPLDRALPILEQVGDALDYAHGQGVIHRDVKPSNVMVEETARGLWVTLMDFGLVKALESSESLTSAGAILGSPEYMAPEQADPNRKDEIGPTTDRYALGVVAYEMLTGRVPFPGNTPATLNAHLNLPPPAPKSAREDLSESVAQVLLKALSKPLGERYPTAMAMVEALRIAIEPEPEQALHPSLTLRLSVKPRTIDAGGQVTWTVTLRNDGDADVRHVAVRHGRTLLDEPFDLAVSRRRRFTFTTICKTKGEKTEKVTVTGIASNGASVRSEASATVRVQPPRPVTTPKTEAPPLAEPEPLPEVLTLEKAGIEMVLIPAGEFLMGSAEDDEMARDDEKPQHTLNLPDYYIARTPVTNAQFARFIKDGGYSQREIWTEVGWGMKEKVGWTQPRFWTARKWNRPNQPVVGVTWYEALAYARWASGTLPSEAEWEKAAGWNSQTGRKRRYPWGNEWDPKKCNASKELVLLDLAAYRGRSTPVGRYSPSGDSAYGLVDMAGNVLEWTRSLYKAYPYDPEDGREDLEAGDPRVLRGGAFYDMGAHVRCASRNWNLPAEWLPYGIRVVVAPNFISGL
jgi:serine/threonine-protein kinase